MVDYSYLFKNSNNIEEASIDSIFYNMSLNNEPPTDLEKFVYYGMYNVHQNENRRLN